MANYYTHLSLAIKPASEEALAWLVGCLRTNEFVAGELIAVGATDRDTGELVFDEGENQLREQLAMQLMAYFDAETAREVIDGDNDDRLDGIEFHYPGEFGDEMNGQGVWMRDGGDGSPNLPALNRCLRAYLQKWDPTGTIGYEVTHTCDKPRTDAYGGSWYLITAEGGDSGSTTHALHMAEQSYRAELAERTKSEGKKDV